jgi:hypothetical protein
LHFSTGQLRRVLKRGCIKGMKVTRISQRHYRAEGMPQVEIEILVEGERYRGDAHAIALLEDGVPLDEIDLVRVDEVDK